MIFTIQKMADVSGL